MRRLPVLQNQSPEDAAAAQRPRWHWTAIGAGFAFTSWLPLAMLALALGRLLGARIVDPSDPAAMAAATQAQRVLLAASALVPIALSFALACGLAGALVGRFGGRAGSREAVLGCALAALLACAVAYTGGGLSLVLAAVAFVILGAWGALFGWLGARVGLKKKQRRA